VCGKEGQLGGRRLDSDHALFLFVHRTDKQNKTVAADADADVDVDDEDEDEDGDAESITDVCKLDTVGVLPVLALMLALMLVMVVVEGNERLIEVAAVEVEARVVVVVSFVVVDISVDVASCGDIE
jgi:hypothetical protein